VSPHVTGGTAVLLPLLAAFGSAATFGLSSSLQHRVVGTTDSTTHTGLVLLRRLAHSPSWVVGICLSVGAFALHAVAISLGSLALVQPVIVSGIVFAVLIRSALDRRLPSSSEVAWSLVTWLGLSLFIAVVHATPASDAPDGRLALGFSVASLLVAAAAVRRARASSVPERQGLWFGVAAGVLFGLVAGLLKMVAGLAAVGPAEVLLRWPAWVMVPAGLWAMTMNQRAYQVTRLSVSMPVLNIVDVVVALGFGAAVFGERVVSSPGSLVAELAGLVLMAFGVRRLARSEEQLGVPVEEGLPGVGRTPGEQLDLAR
jgi:hypothetical protein